MALLLVLGSVLAFADGINDPVIIIHGVSSALSDSSGCPGTCITGLTFSFTSPKSGAGVLPFFTNGSGKTWTSLALIETGPNQVLPNAITCRQTFFTSCTAFILTSGKDKGDVEILMKGLKGLNPRQGILPGQSFVIAFARTDGVGWPKGGVPFSAQAGTVPEPGTIALMVTGLGALVSRRKQWKNRWQA